MGAIFGWVIVTIIFIIVIAIIGYGVTSDLVIHFRNKKCQKAILPNGELSILVEQYNGLNSQIREIMEHECSALRALADIEKRLVYASIYVDSTKEQDAAEHLKADIWNYRKKYDILAARREKTATAIKEKLSELTKIPIDKVPLIW